MRILFISNDLIGGNIAYLLKKEGHNVKLYINEEDRRNNFHNLIPKTSDWKLELDWVGKKGLIVFDDVGYGYFQDRLRKEGYNVFGGTQKGDFLEQNRVLGQRIFGEYGVRTLPIYDFKNITKAINFIKKNPMAWVVKQNGSGSKGLNYVGNFDDGKDVIDILKNYRANNSHDSETITLQKKVVGVEVAVTRYFNGDNWIGPILINIEHKKFFPGDLGPATSEMGTLGWYEKDEKNKLFQETLAKLKPYLQYINYRGVIDINCIVNEKGVFPLEATSRMGSPIIHLQTALNESCWSDILSAITRGEKYDLKYKDGYGIVVLIAIPPFPYTKKIDAYSQIGSRVYFDKTISKEEMNGIHLEEVSFNRIKKQYYISDNRGYILYVTGVGETVQKAREVVYSLIKKIYIPKMFYRNDIGLKFIEESQLNLKKWGYIR